ncbi:uncharacterized protein B0P05DRAFT_528917 [Gilbertella persicaria]|uniref:uncharacterized protein n=1 Tax=Gilbertella persicaria TaxID=101096 RepID=UPI00221F72C3|nr:uncharacterized protein B0P05DRAFT_528917 [Gilbertella persicaria]KAI8091130.1 hypothetical protein B0P05DRAFT_528917 [Gilbertella persicaria]
MLEAPEQKKGLRLKKSLFRQPLDANQPKSPLSRKGQIHISSPILQHSTSIYSLVSPTKNSFSSFRYDELYQPLTSPPPIPQQPNSISPSPRRDSRPMRSHTTMSTCSSSSSPPPRPTHPLDMVYLDERIPIRHVESRRTVTTDPREHPQKSTKTRRHSCSSTLGFKQQQQSTKNTELAPCKSFKSKLKDRRRSSSKSNATISAASAAATASIELSMETSKSTPLRKIKTYNVPKKLVSAEEEERQRKMQELEDLITGRRGSTLKLTLTPKGL